MAEEQQREDSQKTLVAFVVGLLIGGMLVWAFTGPEKNAMKVEKKTDETTASSTDKNSDGKMADKTSAIKVGEGNIVVKDQAASKAIEIDSAEYPVAEGWIGVVQYDNDTLGKVLGVNRFSQSQGLVPEKLELVTPTVKGHKYAIVVYKEDGDLHTFDFAKEVKIDKIFATFMAQ